MCCRDGGAAARQMQSVCRAAAPLFVLGEIRVDRYHLGVYNEGSN